MFESKFDKLFNKIISENKIVSEGFFTFLTPTKKLSQFEYRNQLFKSIIKLLDIYKKGGWIKAPVASAPGAVNGKLRLYDYSALSRNKQNLPEFSNSEMAQLKHYTSITFNLQKSFSVGLMPAPQTISQAGIYGAACFIFKYILTPMFGTVISRQVATQLALILKIGFGWFNAEKMSLILDKANIKPILNVSKNAKLLDSQFSKFRYEVINFITNTIIPECEKSYQLLKKI